MWTALHRQAQRSAAAGVRNEIIGRCRPDILIEPSDVGWGASKEVSSSLGTAPRERVGLNDLPSTFQSFLRSRAADAHQFT